MCSSAFLLASRAAEIPCIITSGRQGSNAGSKDNNEFHTECNGVLGEKWSFSYYDVHGHIWVSNGDAFSGSYYSKRDKGTYEGSWTKNDMCESYSGDWKHDDGESGFFALQIGTCSRVTATSDDDVYKGFNCYGPGHGALDISADFHTDYDECRRKCEGTAGCTAIVTSGNHCFLRSNVDPSKCEERTEWTTTVLWNKVDIGCVGSGSGIGDQTCWPQEKGGKPCCNDQAGTPMICACSPPYVSDGQCQCMSG